MEGVAMIDDVVPDVRNAKSCDSSERFSASGIPAEGGGCSNWRSNSWKKSGPPRLERPCRRINRRASWRRPRARPNETVQPVPSIGAMRYFITLFGATANLRFQPLTGGRGPLQTR